MISLMKNKNNNKYIENDICIGPNLRSNFENSKRIVSLKAKMQHFVCQIFSHFLHWPRSSHSRSTAIRSWNCHSRSTTHSHHHPYPAIITATTDNHHITMIVIHKAAQLSQPKVMLESLAFLDYGKMGTI